MRILRPRFTLRWLMVLVALVGVAAWGWRMVKLRQVYLQIALTHANQASRTEAKRKFQADSLIALAYVLEGKKAGIHRDAVVSGKNSFSVIPTSSWTVAEAERQVSNMRKRLALTSRRLEHDIRLKAKYERAARYPWLPVEPDPPMPE
jgi:hypothetical protein